VKRNPRAIGLLAVSLALIGISLLQLLNNPSEMVQAMNEVFGY
jgi:hypothetical protein